jgi:hypothetical protein
MASEKNKSLWEQFVDKFEEDKNNIDFPYDVDDYLINNSHKRYIYDSAIHDLKFKIYKAKQKNKNVEDA